MIDTKVTKENLVTVEATSDLNSVTIHANLTIGYFKAKIILSNGDGEVITFNIGSLDVLEDFELVLHDALENYKKVLYELDDKNE